jgi:hypothetical protein
MPAANTAGAARYVAVVLLEFQPAWLALSRSQRAARLEELRPAFERHPDVALRWLDADALGHGYSDFVLCEFSDLERYHFLWEEIRDSSLFSVPFVAIKDVMLGIEGGFQRYEASQTPAR